MQLDKELKYLEAQRQDWLRDIERERLVRIATSGRHRPSRGALYRALTRIVGLFLVC